MTKLPRGWVEATIRDLCDLINGKAFKPSDWTTQGLPIVRIQNLNNPNSTFNYYQGLVEEKFLIRSGQLLFAWSGTPGTSFGAHVWNGGKAVLNQHIFKVNFPPDLIDKHFLRNAINQKLEELIGKAHGGAGLQHVTKGKFEETLITLPPLAEQKRIVAKLDLLNAKSAHARTELARIETLVSHYKQAVLSKVFSGEPAAKWPIASLDQVSEVIFDGPFGSNLKSADYRAEGPRVVRLENIGARVFIEEKRTHISDEKFKSLARHTLRANDILFSSFVSEEIRACLFPADAGFEAINKADCFCIRLDTAKIDPQFVLMQLTSESTYRHFVQQVHGATRPRINLSQLRQHKLLLPPVQEQYEIIRRIEAAFAKIDRLAVEAKQALTLLGKLDEAILAKAFRGELVPQDAADEPAEILLARIRAEREAAPKVKSKRIKRVAKMPTAIDFLNAKLENWPAGGVSFQDLKREFGGSYDDLKDAIFASLLDEHSPLQQIFDEKTSTMAIRKRER